MTRKWSGLAPAVDAHLAHWGKADRQKAVFQKIRDQRYQATHDDAVAVFGQDWTATWVQFAGSYGTIGKDGIPVAHTAITDGMTVSGREQMQADEAAVGMGAMLGLIELDMLDKAVTHYVSGEVVSEVTEAAEVMEAEALFDTDLFTPHGFAVLEHPLVCHDLHPTTGVPDHRIKLHIRAIGWTRVLSIGSMLDAELRPGVMVYVYQTREDFTDGYYASVKGVLGEEPSVKPEQVRDGFVLTEVIPWSFGRPWATMDSPDEQQPGTIPSSVAYQRVWFLAFMRLCFQEIIVRHTTHEPRQAHRRWERLAKRKELLDYTTLRLRRIVDPYYTPTGMGLPLEHRVKVRGHWRRVFMPSLGDARMPDGTMNPESHRLTWIESYFKGPEDGPLGALHAATSVIR